MVSVFSPLSERAEQIGAEVVRVPETHEDGTRLHRLTDVAALLRYRIE